jgi:hypothetical protein
MSARACNFTQCHTGNGVIEGIDEWPVHIGIILVPSSPDEVEISKDHHRERATQNFGLNIPQELGRSRMICRVINPNHFKVELRVSMEQSRTQKELTLSDGSHLKNAIPNTQQHST